MEVWVGQLFKGLVLIGVLFFKLLISYFGVCFVFGVICKVFGGIFVYFVELWEYVIDYLYDVGDIQIYVIDIVKFYEYIYQIIYGILVDQFDWVFVIFGGDNFISYFIIKVIVEMKGIVVVF